MRWYKNLYLGDSLKGKKKYYQFMINYTRKLTGIYLLVPAKAPDLIDIYHAEILQIPGMLEKDRCVIGMAGTRGEAYRLAGKIIMDCLERNGNTDIASCFRNS